VYASLFQIPWGYVSAKNWQNWTTSDYTSYYENEKGDVFFGDTVYIRNIVQVSAIINSNGDSSKK